MIDPTTKPNAAPDAIAAIGGPNTFENPGERRDVSRTRDRAPLLMPGFPAPILTPDTIGPYRGREKDAPRTTRERKPRGA
jgi:hypothetical protein